MDLRWSDCTGDTFALRNHQILIDLLREHRPQAKNLESLMKSVILTVQINRT
jgi:hypothetical protein